MTAFAAGGGPPSRAPSTIGPRGPTVPLPMNGKDQKKESIMTQANIHRGEAGLRVGGEAIVLRPSFAALVAAEGELGPLFALVERAAEGRLGLGELVALFWHCWRDRPAGATRDALGDAVADAGLAAATPALRVLLQQILAGT